VRWRRRQNLGISRLLVTFVFSRAHSKRKPTVALVKSRSVLTVVRMTLGWLRLCRPAVAMLLHTLPRPARAHSRHSNISYSSSRVNFQRSVSLARSLRFRQRARERKLELIPSIFPPRVAFTSEYKRWPDLVDPIALILLPLVPLRSRSPMFYDETECRAIN